MLVPYLWRRQMAVVRIVLAACALAAYGVFPVRFGLLWIVLLLFYLLCAVGALFYKRLEFAGYRDEGLLADAAGFLFCVFHPAQQVLGLSLVFYFYLLLAGVLLHERRTVFATMGGLFALLALIGPRQWPSLWPVLLTGGVLACLLTVQRSVLQERLSHSLRRAVLARSEAEVVRIDERQRIAHDFHDGPLQSFISFNMRLELVRRLLLRDPQEAMRELVQLQDLCKQQVAELRSFVRSMRTTEQDAASLDATLRQLLRAFQNDTGMQATLVANDFASPADTDLAMEVLQLVRESLNNVQKHSRASRVTVTLRNEDDALLVSVEDDGAGFPFGGAFSLDELERMRLGPVSIKRRVKNLGGDLLLDSRPGRGASLRMRVPA